MKHPRWTAGLLVALMTLVYFVLKTDWLHSLETEERPVVTETVRASLDAESSTELQEPLQGAPLREAEPSDSPTDEPGFGVETSLFQTPSDRQAFRLLDAQGGEVSASSVEFVCGGQQFLSVSGADGICEFPICDSKPWTFEARVEDRASSGLLAREAFPAGLSNPQDVTLYELVSVTGTVYLDEGVPAVDAQITARYASTVLMGGRPEGASARTDGSGRFSLLLEGTGGAYDLQASWPGMPPCEERVQVNAGEPVILELRFEASEDRLGVVLDPRGAPVSGAEIHVVPAQTRKERGGARFKRLKVRADEGGQFRLEESPRFDSLLIATHPDWAASEPVALQAADSGPSRPLVLQMVPATDLQGWVTWSDGAPVAGAAINVMRDLERPGLEPSHHLMHQDLLYGMSQTQTGSDGSFRVEGLRAVEYGYLLACVPFPDDVERRDQYKVVHDLRAGSRDVRIVLDVVELRGSALQLRVLKEDSREPLTQMTVFLYEQKPDGRWESTSRGVASETGHLERQGLTPGVTYAVAILPVMGYVTALVGPFVASEVPYEETVLLRVPVDVQLRASSSMLGSGARVIHVQPGHAHPHSSSPVLAELDPQGVATLRLGPGAYVAYAPGDTGERQHVTEFRVEPLTGRLEIQLVD